MSGNRNFTIIAKPSDSGRRLDTVVAEHLPATSRSAVASLIRNAGVRVCGKIVKPGYRVRTGDEIQGGSPPPAPQYCQPEPIALDILFEDDHLLVLNKQAGLVVHPAAGNRTGTLVNALLHHRPDLRKIGEKERPGIIHRLDKNTSGALAVAKTASAHLHLSAQFKFRKIEKAYLALVHGVPQSDSGTVDLPIRRHPVDRKRMSAAGSSGGRHALTRWRIRERFPEAALLDVKIETGRTHQIRVHLAAAGFPVVGDTVYGKKKRTLCRGEKKDVCRLLASARRQMLHAAGLVLAHPATDRKMAFTAPLPADMTGLIAALADLQ